MMRVTFCLRGAIDAGMTIERNAVWRTRNRVFAHISEIARPALRVVARLRARGSAQSPAEWRSLVIFGASHIGDTLFRTPSLPVLRRALPSCRIVYVCAPRTAELLTSNPHVDEVLPLMREDGRWRRHPDTIRALRERDLDAALCTDHIAYHADLWLAVRAGIPTRVGFVHKGFSGLVTHAVRARYPRPYAAYTRALVAAVAGEHEDWPLDPQVYPGLRDEEDAVAARRELELHDGTPVVVCTMTVRQRETAVWPAERFIETLALAARHTPMQVVLCGSADDAPYLQQAAARAPRSLSCRVLAGRLGLLGFAAFVRRCDAVLATDSGPRHIANAVGTPVVFIRSLNVSQVEAGAYCATETDAAPDGEFLSLALQRQKLAALRPADVSPLVARAMAHRTSALQV